jgi:hypothetical protein
MQTMRWFIYFWKNATFSPSKNSRTCQQVRWTNPWWSFPFFLATEFLLPLAIFVRPLLVTAPAVLHISFEFLKYLVSCNADPLGHQRAWPRERWPYSIRSGPQRPRRLHGHPNQRCRAPKASDQGSPRFWRHRSPSSSSTGEFTVTNHHPFML